MKTLLLLLLLLIVNSPLLAQFFDNYIQQTSNSSSPSIANTLVGEYAGRNTTTGSGNTFYGYHVGEFNTTGSTNVFLGAQAGGFNSTGSNNILLGYNTHPTSGTLQNAVAIGANATVALSNAIVLGNPTNISIAVGIGTDSPQFPLDVRGIINLRNNGTIKFSHLINPFLRNGYTDQFLTVNERGETVLARHRLRIENVNQWSDKVFEQGYPLQSLSQVENHIQHHGHLSNMPSAKDVLKEGIDPAKMDAKLLEKIEELTLYSIQQQKRIDQLEKANQVNQQQQKEIDDLKEFVKQLLNKK